MSCLFFFSRIIDLRTVNYSAINVHFHSEGYVWVESNHMHEGGEGCSNADLYKKKVLNN